MDVTFLGVCVKRQYGDDMRTLILGAKGMLGRALTEAFAPWEPVCWDIEELDITEPELVLEKVGDLSPTYIVNAAAYTDVDGAEDNRTGAYAVNEAGVRNVARAAAAAGALLVHYSTDYVYPAALPAEAAAEGEHRLYNAQRQFIGYPEDWPPGPPANAYGASKLAGERALAQEMREYYLIRTAWLYGPGGRNFVDTMLRLGVQQEVVRVVNDQHGSPTYVRDLAEATWRLLDEEYDPDIYHLVNSGVTTWYELAAEIFQQAHLSAKLEPVSTREHSRPAVRPAWSVLQNTRGPAVRDWRRALYNYLELVL